jgi:DnaJ-domain-containing protein 1
MSFGKRLFNIARAELRDAARKLKTSAEELLGGTESAGPDVGEEDNEDVKKKPSAEKAANPSEAMIQRYYANLELPIGASLSEVKAAYRRLMRRYHPDLHQDDAKKAEVATKLAQELRVAYEALVAHLGVEK